MAELKLEVKKDSRYQLTELPYGLSREYRLLGLQVGSYMPVIVATIRRVSIQNTASWEHQRSTLRIASAKVEDHIGLAVDMAIATRRKILTMEHTAEPVRSVTFDGRGSIERGKFYD